MGLLVSTVSCEYGANATTDRTPYSMSKAYCKWPVVAAIIIGALIVLHLVVSLVRCMCCGLECCFACCACCNACCPSPRGSSRKDSGGTYKQQPQWPQGPQPYGFVNPMAYGPPAGTGGVATFDAPSKSMGMGARTVTEDSLPIMPTWESASTRRVEDPDAIAEEEDADAHLHQEQAAHAEGGQSYAMSTMNPTGDEARQSLLAPQPQRPIQQSALQNPVQSPYDYQDTGYHSPAQNGFEGRQAQQNYAANPYQDNTYHYNIPQQGISHATPAPSYHTQQPMSPYQQRPAYPAQPPQQTDNYYGANPYQASQYQQQPTYEADTSYNSYAPQRASSGGWGEGGVIDRRPVNGSWRDV